MTLLMFSRLKRLPYVSVWRAAKRAGISPARLGGSLSLSTDEQLTLLDALQARRNPHA